MGEGGIEGKRQRGWARVGERVRERLRDRVREGGEYGW